MSNLNLEVLVSPPGLILLVNQQASSSWTPSRSRNSDKDHRGPSRSPPQAPGGPRLLNEEKSLCLLRGFLALETLQDHLLLLILLVVAIPVSPQE